MRTLILIALCAAGLAACSKLSEDSKPQATEGQAATPPTGGATPAVSEPASTMGWAGPAGGEKPDFQAPSQAPPGFDQNFEAEKPAPDPLSTTVATKGQRGEARNELRTVDAELDEGEQEESEQVDDDRDRDGRWDKRGEDRWEEEKKLEEKEVARDGTKQKAKKPATLDGLEVSLEQPMAPPPDDVPLSFLPRSGYFENTYLGGNAAHEAALHRLERDLGTSFRPWVLARLPSQPLDPPEDQALALSATVDRRWVDQPSRVYLQVAIRGSTRYGWRRPPLDAVLVLDAGISRGDATELVAALLRGLGPQDRLGVVATDREPVTLAEPQPVSSLRRLLAAGFEAPRAAAAHDLEQAVDAAGSLLREAARDQARVPGSQVVLVAVGDASAPEARAEAAARAAHRLTLQGAVTSVLQIAAGSGDPWWQVAAAGHGNAHQATPGDAASIKEAVTSELELLARVVARLVRLDVRLAPGVQAVRILGSRLLGQVEVREVKEREVATDRQLSITLGVKADRGDDDEGLQTVIPAFYGGDSHVVILELWAERPGPVADVSLRYKDMIALGNATSSASVALAASPRPHLPEQELVLSNTRGHQLAAALRRAGRQLRGGAESAARQELHRARQLASGTEDRALVDGLSQLLDQGRPTASVAAALELASDRRIGFPSPAP